MTSLADLEDEANQFLLRLFVWHANRFLQVVSEKLSKEQYVLTQCGTTVPSEAEIEQVGVAAVRFAES